MIFRKLDPQSPDGRIIREYSARGELVPDEVTVRVFLNWLEAQRAARRYQPSEELLLLDGIPRNVNQCEMLQKYIDVKLLLHFVCHDEEAMIERIRRRAALENRVDDADESVTRRRFEVYHRETQPVLDFYSEGVVREIDSMQRPAAVLRDCLKSLVPVIEDCYPVD